MHIFANSEDPDEMPHDVAIHQGLHCLPRQKRSSEKEIQFDLEILTCHLSICTMDYSKFIVLNQKEKSTRDLYKPSILFMGYKQTVQTKNRHCRMLHLFKVFTVGLQKVTQMKNYKWKWICQIDKGCESLVILFVSAGA